MAGILHSAVVAPASTVAGVFSCLFVFVKINYNRSDYTEKYSTHDDGSYIINYPIEHNNTSYYLSFLVSFVDSL